MPDCETSLGRYHAPNELIVNAMPVGCLCEPPVAKVLRVLLPVCRSNDSCASTLANNLLWTRPAAEASPFPTLAP